MSGKQPIFVMALQFPKKLGMAEHISRMVVWRGGGVNTGLWCGNLRERDNLEGLGVDGRVMLKWISKKWDGSMDWIDLAEDRDRWQALVNAVMNLRVP